MTRPVAVMKPNGEVIETHERLGAALDLAQELWRLIGDEDRRQAIANVVTSAYAHKPPTLQLPQLRQLHELVIGLDQAIVGPLTDAHEQLSWEKVGELRGRTSLLDLAEARGEDARWAVSEAMVQITSLQNILKSAIDEGNSFVFR